MGEKGCASSIRLWLGRQVKERRCGPSLFERVTGTLGGRSGSFVLQGVGTWEEGVARTTWTVVPGSGTGQLTGLRGEGGIEAAGGQAEITYRLDYDFG